MGTRSDLSVSSVLAFIRVAELEVDTFAVLLIVDRGIGHAAAGELVAAVAQPVLDTLVVIVDIGDGRYGPLLHAEQAGRNLAERAFRKRMIDIPSRHLEASDAHDIALIQTKR